MSLPRPLFCRLGLVLLPALLAACQPEAPSPAACFTRQNLFLGTMYTVTIYHHQPEGAVYAAYERLVRDLNRLERSVDFQSPGSEISRINIAGGGMSIALSDPFCGLLDAAGHYYKTTDGCFDVTVHPLLAEWGFYRQQRMDPDPERLKDILPRIGFHRLDWRQGSPELHVPAGGVQLDFGGMIKGVALDRSAAILHAAGLDNFHLAFGRSSHYAAGPAAGRGWRIPIAAPRNPERVLLEARLDGHALAISAGGEVWRSHSGESYSFIVDPRTGRPVTAPAMTMVIAARGTAADAWSTALLVDEGLLRQKNPLPDTLLTAVVIDAAGILHWYPDRATAEPFFANPSP